MILAPKPMMRDNSQETRRLALELGQVEERIHAQEKARGFDQVRKLGWQLAEAQARLEQLMGEWESLAA